MQGRQEACEYVDGCLYVRTAAGFFDTLEDGHKRVEVLVYGMYPPEYPNWKS
jgi:hypothetical protein